MNLCHWPQPGVSFFLFSTHDTIADSLQVELAQNHSKHLKIVKHTVVSNKVISTWHFSTYRNPSFVEFSNSTVKGKFQLEQIISNKKDYSSGVDTNL